MKVCNLIKIKAHIPSILSIHLKVRLSIRLTNSQGAKYLKIRLAQFSCQKRFDFISYDYPSTKFLDTFYSHIVVAVFQED